MCEHTPHTYSHTHARTHTTHTTETRAHTLSHTHTHTHTCDTHTHGHTHTHTLKKNPTFRLLHYFTANQGSYEVKTYFSTWQKNKNQVDLNRDFIHDSNSDIKLDQFYCDDLNRTFAAKIIPKIMLFTVCLSFDAFYEHYLFGTEIKELTRKEAFNKVI
ncbi:MAG: hypothetical protein O7C56_08595 [Rickettsia endosymbiont of Ixodes persulcatus]|nr:hypothetical protein [Rickettsia endosymbiont of Ixodes persulcatus]